MLLGRIVGTVVATRKDPRLEGKKLLICRLVDPDGKDEKGYIIAVDTVAVAAGDYVLRIHNAGPDQHELIVVPDHGGGLPLRGDGFTTNEEAIQSSEPGAVDPQHPGATTYLRVHLKPGRYVLFCNMAGHFMAGMHTDLVVS